MPLQSVKKLVKRVLPQAALDAYDRRQFEASLSNAARAMREAHRRGLPADDSGAETAIRLAADWLCRAQDQATPRDGGVARHFSLFSGWSPSYPETTGYIVPTFIELQARFPAQDFATRARQMLDWLVQIQLDSGAYQGGMISHDPVPVTFNTGQILLGLTAGVKAYDRPADRAAMINAANWLRDTQDDDGCWRKFGTPFAAPGDKTYETHVAWGLLEAARVTPGNGYGEAGLRQIHWAIGNIQPNGWLQDCCLSNPEEPLTHTLGYALRGIIEGYRYSDDPALLASAEKIGGGLLGCVGDDGYLPGRLDRDWRPSVKWVCLTGSVQIAACFLDLFDWTKNAKWRDGALLLNRYVRRTLVTTGDPDLVGAVAGSFPIDGDYGQFEYLNWAAKFFIDANCREIEVRQTAKASDNQLLS